MKYVRSFGICLFSVLFYFAVSIVAYLFINNTVWATIVADMIVAVIGFIYYKKSRMFDTKASYSISVLFAFMIFMIVMWFFTQITTTFVSNSIIDNNYNTYVELSESDTLGYLLLTFFVAPATEELLMRGIVFRELKKTIPIGFVYLISSVVFALMHGTVVHLFVAMMSGFLFAIIYEYSDSIICPIIFHSVFNFMSIILSGIELPDILFEPAFFVSEDIILVLSMVGIAHYIYRHRKRLLISTIILQDFSDSRK